MFSCEILRFKTIGSSIFVIIELIRSISNSQSSSCYNDLEANGIVLLVWAVLILALGLAEFLNKS